MIYNKHFLIAPFICILSNHSTWKSLFFILIFFINKKTKPGQLSGYLLFVIDNLCFGGVAYNPVSDGILSGLRESSMFVRQMS